VIVNFDRYLSVFIGKNIQFWIKRNQLVSKLAIFKISSIGFFFKHMISMLKFDEASHNAHYVKWRTKLIALYEKGTFRSAFRITNNLLFFRIR